MKWYFTFAPGILASCRPTASWLCGGSGRSPWGHHPGSLCRSAHPQPVTVNIPVHLTDCHSQQTYEYISQIVTVSKYTSTSHRLSQSVNIPAHLTDCHSVRISVFSACHSKHTSTSQSLSQSANIPVHLTDCHSQ